MMNREIKKITVGNIKKGDVTLLELNEIYKMMGFVFEAHQGKFTKIRKEIKH